MDIGVGHSWLKWVGHSWLKWVGQLQQSEVPLLGDMLKKIGLHRSNLSVKGSVPLN